MGSKFLVIANAVEAAGNEGGLTDPGTATIDDNVFALTGGGYVVVSATGGNPYLDDLSGGPGGLGVCTDLSGSNQCDPSSDDDVTSGESLTLTFYTDGTLSTLMVVTKADILFHNGNHGTTFAGEVEISIDGGAST